LLQQHGLQGPVLAFAPLRGYLRGFIDLVFEHQGRFHVLDWKSNHLGDTAAHYEPAALQAAMAAQGYHLQLLLYTLALHRWLQQRLRGYDYEMHMGEGLYLFVRGVRPGWQDEVGRPCGVHAWRPPRELIEALSALLGPIDDAPGLPSLLDDPRIASGL
jgi:exodeoxyribonuclease V beta subunit